MTKKELAKRWDVTVRLLDSNRMTTVLPHKRIEASNGAKCLIDFDIEGIEEFEKKHCFPPDPINIHTSLKILGLSNQNFYYYKKLGLIKNFTSLNGRVFLYSRSEIEELSKKLDKSK